MADTDTQANCEDVCRGGEEAGLEKRHHGADGSARREAGVNGLKNTVGFAVLSHASRLM